MLLNKNLYLLTLSWCGMQGMDTFYDAERTDCLLSLEHFIFYIRRKGISLGGFKKFYQICLKSGYAKRE